MSRKILVVEDERLLREILVDYLRSQGYEVSCAEDGIEALEKIRLNPPDLVILDIELPKLNGIDLLEQARESFPSMIFLVLTANEDENTARAAISLGAYDYLVKPFELEVLQTKFLSRIFD